MISRIYGRANRVIRRFLGGREESGNGPVAFMHDGREYYLNRDGSARYHVRNSIEKIARMVRLIDGDAATIIDVGANCGLFAAFAAARLPRARVHAFEPSRELIPIIEMNCRHGEVAIHATALGDRTARQTLYVNPNSQQTNSFNLDAVTLFARREDIEERQVDCTTLDAVVSELGISNVDVLKIDVQGAEGAVLRGARATIPLVRQLFIESTWMDVESIAEIIPFALDRGFTHAAVVNPVRMGADILLSRMAVEGADVALSFALTEDLLGGRWR